ncbi:MAG TPA: homoserine kinase [Methylophilaceae bacterium]
MSVFTTVSPEQLSAWLEQYPAIGALSELKGIASGITNTNYFVITDTQRYVLTLFEHHNAEELPYFLNLMAHLAAQGIDCPKPLANLHNEYLERLNEKPAAMVSCLNGKDLKRPTPDHCAQVGDFLARMHLAGLSYPAHMDNPRGPHWFVATAQKVMPHLDPATQQLLQNELDYQAEFRDLKLPRGVIHGDLFKDNILFDGDKLGGAIDFYYACNDVLVYDLAITVNDWCVLEDGALDAPRLQAMLRAYHAQRPLSGEERDAWVLLLRAGALRFWLSRLHDFHFPLAGELTHAKDPGQFQRILEARIRDEAAIRNMWV